jgi:hypothetical protein
MSLVYVSCMNPFAKIFIDFHLIYDNISERGLIHVEILLITTMLAFKGKLGLFHPELKP